MRRARAVVSMTLSVVLTLGSSACLLAPRTPKELEPELVDGRMTSLYREEGVSDGRPIVVGPFAKHGEMRINAACLGDGRIDIKLYGDVALMMPNAFTAKHDGAMGYLEGACDGTAGSLFLNGDSLTTQYCMVVRFNGNGLTYRVTVNGETDASPTPTSSTAKATPWPPACQRNQT
jgi:hypothetical protein